MAVDKEDIYTMKSFKTSTLHTNVKANTSIKI